MPWTTPRSWVAGEVVTAAQLNTDIRDNMNFLGSLLSTGTLTNRGMLYGSGTAVVGATPALGTGAIVVGGTGGTADPTTLAVFAGTGAIGSYRLLGTYGGLNADVSAATAGALVVGSSTGTFTVVDAGPSGSFYRSRGTGTVGTWAAAAGNITIITTGTFTSTNTAAHDVATVSIAGLGITDRLIIFYAVDKVNTGTPGTYGLRQVEDNVQLVRLTSATLQSGDWMHGQVNIQISPSSTIRPYVLGLVSSQADGATFRVEIATAVSTSLLGTWTLAIRSPGQGTTGTIYLSWTVLKVS